MKSSTTLEQLQRGLRARVCAGCKDRSDDCATKTVDHACKCEETCSLFVHLPVLRQAARQLDPMLADRPKVLQRILRRIGRDKNGAWRLKSGRVVQLLEEMFRP
jgi:hypothetical protein